MWAQLTRWAGTAPQCPNDPMPISYLTTVFSGQAVKFLLHSEHAAQTADFAFIKAPSHSSISV